MDPRQALKEWRAGRSYVTVSRLIGIDPTYVRYLELDPDRQPSVTVAAKIEAATGIPCAAWARRDPAPQAEGAPEASEPAA